MPADPPLPLWIPPAASCRIGPCASLRLARSFQRTDISAPTSCTPRVSFAMGERGDFPAFFGSIHPRFRTPHVSIMIFAVLLLIFSIAGDFRWNALLSSVARLFVYGSVAAALPVLRKKNPLADAFRLPCGIFFSVLALAFCAFLVIRMHRQEFFVIAVTTGLAFVTS